MSSTESEEENLSQHKSTSKAKTKAKEIAVPVVSAIVPAKEKVEQKDLIKNQIDAIVTSCFQPNRKETKRKIKLGKRTAADDREFDEEEEYLSQLTEYKSHRFGKLKRKFSFSIFFFVSNFRNALNKSHLQDDEEKVTRETAAYDRLEAVLRVTKPLCEKSNRFDDDDEEDEEQVKERRGL